MKKVNFSKWMMWVTALYLILPLVLTFLYSFSSEWINVLPTGFTFKYYMQILPRQDFYMSLARTLLICVLTIVLAGILMLLAMYVVTVYHPKFDKYLQILCMIPYALQGIIIAISILTLYSGAKGLFGSRIIMLVGTYCIIILPYMYQGIRNALRAVSARELIEAAQILGCTRFYAFFRIIVQ